MRKLGTVKSELEQEVRNRNHFAGELKKEKNNLERERESRLQDIHMKSLDRQRIDKLQVAKEKLEKQLKMMDSISKGHTHESEILKKALDCSRNVSEMYEERLVLDDDEIADLKIRNALMVPVLYDSVAHVEKTRESLETNVCALIRMATEDNTTLPSLNHLSMPGTFYIVYQGFNDAKLIAAIRKMYSLFYSRLERVYLSQEEGYSLAYDPAVNSPGGSKFLG